jgi:hypothetical protein
MKKKFILKNDINYGSNELSTNSYNNSQKNVNVYKNPNIIRRNQNITKPNNDKDKKIDLPNLIKYTKGKPLKASDKKIPTDILEAAQMAQASRVFDESLQINNNNILASIEAQNYLDDLGIKWTIESSLSNSQGLVLISNEEGVVRIAYRGTDGGQPQEILTDIFALFGSERYSPEWGDVNSQINLVINELGTPEMLIGFSRGSLFSINLGNDFLIPTIELNPAVSPDIISNQDIGSFHDVFRTEGDPVSILLKGIKDNNPNWKIRSIEPLKDTLNAWQEHKLVQLLTNDSPRRQGIENYLQENVKNQTIKAGEMAMLKELYTAIENKMNFSDYMREFNSGDIKTIDSGPNNDIIGELFLGDDGNESNITYNNELNSSRVYKGSNYTELWDEAGGVFTKDENRQINRVEQTGKGFQMNKEERSSFLSKTPSQQEQILKDQIDTQIKAQILYEKYNLEPAQIQDQILRESTIAGLHPEISTAIRQSLHPMNLSSGLIGGFFGGIEASSINKLTGNYLNDWVVQGLGGGLGSVNASAITSILSGTARSISLGGLAPEFLSGAAGAVLAYESQKWISNALQNDGYNSQIVKSVSSIAGGAIGGVATVATSAALSTAAFALTGGEFGSAFAPETFGLSILLGAGIGAGLGALTYGLGEFVDLFDNKEVDPYYVAPDFNSMDQGSTLRYLYNKQQKDQMRLDDERNNITPQQRNDMNNNSSKPQTENLNIILHGQKFENNNSFNTWLNQVAPQTINSQIGYSVINNP